MKQKNTTLQYKFLQMMGEREPKLCLELQNNFAHGRRNRLEQALEKALQW